MAAGLNIGKLDRLIRLSIGITLVGIAAASRPADGDTGIAWAVGVFLFATAATGFSPLYALAGISTRGRVRRRRRTAPR